MKQCLVCGSFSETQVCKQCGLPFAFEVEPPELLEITRFGDARERHLNSQTGEIVERNFRQADE